jgi:hypothetical protein
MASSATLPFVNAMGGKGSVFWFCRVSLLYSCIHIFSNIETWVNTVESLLEYVAKSATSGNSAVS